MSERFCIIILRVWETYTVARLSGLARSAETPEVHIKRFSQDLLASEFAISIMETRQLNPFGGRAPRITTLVTAAAPQLALPAIAPTRRSVVLRLLPHTPLCFCDVEHIAWTWRRVLAPNNCTTRGSEYLCRVLPCPTVCLHTLRVVIARRSWQMQGRDTRRHYDAMPRS